MKHQTEYQITYKLSDYEGVYQSTLKSDLSPEEVLENLKKSRPTLKETTIKVAGAIQLYWTKP